MKPRLITRTDDFAQALKDWRHEEGLKHADVDHIVGWQDAYCSKVEGFDRSWGKKPFNMTQNAVDLLQAMDMGLVLMPYPQAIELVDSGTVRLINQIAREGKTTHKEARVSCQVLYRTRK